MPVRAKTSSALPTSGTRCTRSPGEIVRPVELEPLIAVARRLSAELQWRAACFGARQFVDPAWDLILHLFIAEEGVDGAAVGQLADPQPVVQQEVQVGARQQQ